MKSSVVLDSICFCSLCIPSSPLHLCLGNGGGCQSCYRDRGSWKLKKKSAQERREVVKFLTEEVGDLF